MAALDQLLHIKKREDFDLYNRLRSIIWVFNIEDHKFWWANQPALKFWEKETLEEFLAIDLSDDSPVVRERLIEIFETASSGKLIEENWTLYPGGNPKMVIITFTPILIEDGKKAVLIEASPQLKEELDPRAKRILEAVRYTPLIISTYTDTGVLLAQNPAAAHIYGAGSGGDVTLRDRYDSDAIEKSIQSIGGKQQRVVTDFQVPTQYGMRWHTLTAEAARDPVTGARVIVITEEDITDRVRMQEELRQLNATLEQRVAERTAELSDAIQEAKEANRAKTDFLATMSHELRTPLNAIIGFSEMLNRGVYGPTTDRQISILDDIHKSGRNLLNQINDLLDASTIDRGKLNLFESTFPVKSTLEYCGTIFSIEARRKNQQLDIRLPDEEIQIRADEHRFTQILSNLVSNALKYTPENGTISVSAKREENGELSIQITDNGIGIAVDQIGRVTDAFTQVDISSSFISGKGVGLGLYITSSLLKAHGGRLSLEPNDGENGITARAILPQSRLIS